MCANPACVYFGAHDCIICMQGCMYTQNQKFLSGYALAPGYVQCWEYNVNATRNDYHLFICLLIHSFILSFLRLLFLDRAKLRRAHASMAQIAVVLQTAEQLLVRDLLKVPTHAVYIS